MKYTLVLSQQEMRVLNDALVEMPFRLAAPVIQSINEQLSRGSGGQDSSDTETNETKKSAAST